MKITPKAINITSVTNIIRLCSCILAFAIIIIIMPEIAADVHVYGKKSSAKLWPTVNN